MRCELCASSDRLRVPGLADGETERPDGAQCVSCGRPVAGGAGERLLRKLSQLARFGLAGPPILATRRRAG